MNDRDLMANVIYSEYEQLRPWQRATAYWIIAPDMLLWLGELFPPERPYGLAQPGELGYGSPPQLLGRPVEIRGDVQGIHLEVTG